MDWGGQNNHLAPSLPQYNPIGIFFLWIYIKDQAFHPKVDSVVELRTRINNPVASMTPQMLKNTWCAIMYHLDILLAHIEMY
jgi:hypothetical protein